MKKLLLRYLMTVVLILTFAVGLNVAEENKSQPPEGWGIYLKQGQEFYNKGKYDEAVNSLKKAIAINAKADAPHYVLAMIYEKQGENEQAIAEWTEFMKLSSNKELVKNASVHLERLRNLTNE